MPKKIMDLDKPAIVRIHEVGRLFKGHPKGVGAGGKPTIGRDYGTHYLRFEPDTRFKNEPSESGFPSLYEELKDRWETIISRRSVRVSLPFPTIGECMAIDNSVVIKWGTGTKKAASCDGRVCSLSFSIDSSSGKKKYEFDRNPKPCMVADDGICPMGCAPKALLKLIIPDLYPGGIVIFPLGSPIDIDSVRGTLTRFEQYGLNGIPFSLFRKATRVNYSDDRGEQSRDNWGVNLDIDPVVASKLMSKVERRFDRFLESDSDIIDADAIEVPQQRSIAPAPTAPNFKKSDDGYNFLNQVRVAMNEGSLELLSDAVEIARELVESGYYDRSGLAWIDLEESRARSSIRELSSVMPAPIVPKKAQVELSPARQRINFFRLKTEIPVADLATMATRLDLPPSAEMTDDDAIVLVGEMLSAWAMDQSEKISPAAAHLLVEKSIESTTTDEALWADFEMRVEAHISDNG